MNHYQCLGVHRDASAHAIKQAYRRMAKIHHPDRNQHDIVNAQFRMQMIIAAYKILSDEDSRREYDEGFNVVVPEPAVEEAVEKVERKVMRDYSNRFESKDALMGVLISFFGMLSIPSDVDLRKFLASICFFIICVLAGIVARGFARTVHERFREVVSESFVNEIFYNAIGAGVMASMIKLVHTQMGFEIFRPNALMVMWAVIIPSAVGAGFGRAFNRSVGVIGGMVGGAALGMVAAIVFALWCIALLMAGLGLEAKSSDLAVPLQVIMFSSAMAGALGSVRFRKMIIFTWLEWIEDQIGRFGPDPEISKAVAITDDIK